VRVLSIGNFGHGWDGSICDEEHIASALEELGHEVIRHQRDEENIVPTQEVDFILISQYDQYKKNMVDRLRQWGKCPIVYWAFDYQADGQEWHERLVKEADLYLSKRIADSKYPNWQYLAQDFAPSFLDNPAKLKEKAQDIDVLFTGSYLPWATERNETIKAVDEKFNLVVHSVNDWPFLERRPPVMDEELIGLYGRTKIVLSIDHTLEAGYWSDRNAQAMCCGAFVLGRYVPMMETVFRSNIIYFYNIEDCLEKIEYYLESEDREVLAHIGYEYAQTNLKVRERAADLLTIVRSIL
jgi:hypothetical protein